MRVRVCTPKFHERGDSHVPQPMAPIIIPANIEENRAPIWLSGTELGKFWSGYRWRNRGPAGALEYWSCTRGRIMATAWIHICKTDGDQLKEDEQE